MQKQQTYPKKVKQAFPSATFTRGLQQTRNARMPNPPYVAPLKCMPESKKD